MNIWEIFEVYWKKKKKRKKGFTLILRTGRGLVLRFTGPAHLHSHAQGPGHVEGARQEGRFRAGKAAEARPAST